MSRCLPSLVEADVKAQAEKEAEAVMELEALLSVELEGLKKIHTGKVHDMYEVDGLTLLRVETDRVQGEEEASLIGVPARGKIFTQLAAWWFDFIDKNLGTRHYFITADMNKMPEGLQPYSEDIRGRSMLLKKVDMIPIEFSVRGYLVGHALQEYNKTGRFAGITLPLGLRERDPLPRDILSAYAIEEDGTRRAVSSNECVEQLGFFRLTELASISLSLYQKAARHLKTNESGVVIAEARFQFGIDPKTQNLVLASAPFTPDSSLIWENKAHLPEGIQDVDLVSATLNKYEVLFNDITGSMPNI